MSGLPNLPSQLIPLQTFKDRLLELGLGPLHEHEGGSDSAWLDEPGLRLIVRHSGYGGGHGGNGPVQVLEYIVQGGAAKPGALVASDIERRIHAIHRVLTAPAPAVHAYHPTAIRLRVLAFWEQTGCKKYRFITAPNALAEVLHSGASLFDRLRAYGTAAAMIDAEVVVRRSNADGAVLFRGAGEKLRVEAGALAAAGGPHVHVWASKEGALLTVEDGHRAQNELASQVATRISQAKQEGRLTWLEVDGSVPAETTLTPGMEVANIRAALEALIDATDATLFSVERDGVVKEVKRGKLVALATSLRDQLKAGKLVRVASSSSAPAVKSARLEF
jgi:hypothetical protein